MITRYSNFASKLPAIDFRPVLRGWTGWDDSDVIGTFFQLSVCQIKLHPTRYMRFMSMTIVANLMA